MIGRISIHKLVHDQSSNTAGLRADRSLTNRLDPSGRSVSISTAKVRNEVEGFRVNICSEVQALSESGREQEAI